MLDLVSESGRRDYVERTGKTDDEISAMFDAETWMNADQAVAEGFADEIGIAVVKDDAVKESVATFASRSKKFQQSKTEDEIGATPHRVAAQIRNRKNRLAII